MSGDLLKFIIPGVLVVGALLAWFLIGGQRRQRIDQRIARVTKRKGVVAKRGTDALSLRKAKETGVPFLGKILQGITSMDPLRARLERAGMNLAPDMFVAACGGIFLFVTLVLVLLHKPAIMAFAAAAVLGGVFPYVFVGMKGNKRIKKFLTLFPDAIDFIVRGLRSGLPVTESMNMVGTEMEQPIGGIFASIGESVRLGVPVDKALYDTARKLKSTEFNFFVTSIVLQRETGGNLSEILSNLSEVLRQRFMMRMKIKAMSSEAKASAMIVGALPFVVIVALTFVSPGYLDPLVDTHSGHVAVGIACAMMTAGIGIMTKMTRFEI